MPVDVASGVVFTAAHDLEIWPATVPLVFRRTYSTARLDRPPSIFGRGWTHRFDARLIRDLEGFRFFGHDGSEVVFNTTDARLEAGEAAVNLNDCMELRREGTRYAVWHWHGWEGPLEKFMFDASKADIMQLSAIELPSGHALVLGYDPAGRLRRIEQKIERRVALLDYNEAGLLERLSLAWLGGSAAEPVLVARYAYTSDHQLRAAFDATGAAIEYAYDNAGRLVAETSRSGWRVLMRYDAEGRCVELGAPNGYQQRAFQYLGITKETVVTDSLGQTTRYFFDENGRVRQVLHPNGEITAKEFDAFGRTLRVVGPSAPGDREVGYVYDDRGDLVEVRYAGGLTRRLEYNASHQVTAIHDITGGVWRLQYQNGQVSAITNPLDERTAYAYDSFNVLSEIATPWGNRIQFVHDDRWSWEEQRDVYGLVIRYDYDIRLNIIRTANALTEVARCEYDVLGRLVALTTPDGARRTLTWTPGRRVAEYVSATGAVVRLDWSPEMLCRRRTDPNGFIHRLEYDTEGRLIAIVNPKEERSSFVWDCLGRPLAQTFFDGRTQRWEYDRTGQCTATIRPDGTRLNIRYNDFGQVAQVETDDQPILAYQYDEGGRFVGGQTSDGPIGFSYDLCGRIIAEVQHGKSIRYTYDSHGAVVTRIFEGGRIGRLLLEYDLRGRLTRLADPRGAEQRFEYDGRDLVTRRTFAGVTERLEYNYAGRPIEQVVAGRQCGTIARKYYYDPESNLTAVASSNIGNLTYRYDPGERMVRAEGPGNVLEQCRYDSSGNLTQRGPVTLEYGAGDRLLRIDGVEIERDTNGNVIREIGKDGATCFFWDALGQLKAVKHSNGSITSYGYDAIGRRLFKEHDGLRTDFFWAGDDLLCETTAGSMIEYAIDQFWPHAIWQDGEPRHAVVSPNGRIHELIDQDGYLVWSGAYDAWGSLVVSSGTALPPSLRLPGQYWDPETGLHYNRHRYYDPRSLSFISPDPIGFVGGVNAFLYAPNPVTYDDPLGLKCNVPAGKEAVYVLTKGQPPQVVYVGITNDPHTRVSGHKSANKDFDNMRVVAVVDDHRSARNIEGNLLHGIHEGNVTSVAGMPVRVDSNGDSDLQNSRRSDGSYYHSYVPDPNNPAKSTRGHPTMDAAALNNATSNTRAPVPRPA